MADADPQPGTGRLQLAATLIASSVLGAPLVIASAVQAVVLTVSPATVSESGIVTTPAAIVAFVASFVAAVGAVALVFSRLAAQAGSRSVLRTPLMVLLVQLVLGVLVVAIAASTVVVVLV